MRIKSTDHIKTEVAGKSKKKGKTESSEFSKLLGDSDATSETSSAQAAAPADGLLLAQEIDGDEEQRRQAKLYGEGILDQLEDIRLNLLTGRITQAQLERLSTLIQNKKKVFSDPKIKEILMDIELRAKVELAKFEQS